MNEFKDISVRAARRAESIGQHVLIQGWLRTRRDSKAGFSFLEVNDGSCLGNIQVLAPQSLPNYESDVKQLHPGASLAIQGVIKESVGAGQATEVEALSIQVYGLADPEHYPLQKKRHSFEKLREWAHLRPRTNTLGAVARVRNRICHSIHQFFQELGFLYVHTPIITARDCEGAGAMLQVTTLDLETLAKKQLPNVDFQQDFFGRPAYLTVSGQLEGEIFACALGKIYTFGPTFRAENSNTSRHLAEFWMIEPEMAFYDLDDNMDLAEAFIKRIVCDALQDCTEDMQLFNQHVEPNILDMLKGVADKPFVRASYTDAIDILQKSSQTFEHAVSWGMDLQSEHERFLTEQHFQAPVILFNYPRTLKPFYMYCNDDDRTVRAMDVLVPRVGEIIGGSQREHRLDLLVARMQEQGLNPDDYWWYLDLRRFGTVPHAGFGLGLERAVQFVTGMANIRDVIPFPRTPGHASP
ncbi:MAG TPA: asparagine--tRNA ligase [Pirellulaceae bacterium]|nr:asparagine--tRNA ligase [Pirellulaceae bacterium]